MHTASQHSVRCQTLLVVALIAPCFPIPAAASELMPPAQQNALVQKYCAVCHTDAARNGGLSLQHYDASQANPALAAMLLSKLRNGAMGAAGLGIPDPAAREAWVQTTTAQAELAQRWTVIRTDVPAANAQVLTASIVRDVAPRKLHADSPVYRLTLGCNNATRKGDIQLTWSPAAQTNRTFSVAVDGNAGTPHQLEGKEEQMGNGTPLSTGLAATQLNIPLPEKSLTIAELFPGETVVFPLDQLQQVDRQQLAACLAPSAME